MKEKEENSIIDSAEKKNSVPEKEHSIAQKAAARKSRNKTLARHLRKTSQIVSLNADISTSIEGIDGLSGTISEQFVRTGKSVATLTEETNEEIRALEALSDASLQAHEAVSEIYYAFDDVFRIFTTITKTLDTMHGNIQGSEKLAADVKKDINEVEAAIEQSEDLIKRIQRITEHADIAGLNSSLEAGRAGEHGESFAVVAAGVQKSVSGFTQAADELYRHVSELKTRAADVSEKKEGTSDRLRTVSVLAKGIRSAFDDMTAGLDSLRDQVDELSLCVDEIAPSCDEVIPVVQSLLESVRAFTKSIERARSDSENLNISFAGAVDCAEKLSVVTDKLASEKNSHAFIDEIYTAAEDFTEAVEETTVHIDNSIHATGEMLKELEGFEHTSARNRERTGVLSSNLETIITTARSIEKNSETFRERLKDSYDVLKEVSREIHALGEENKALMEGFDSFRSSVAHVVHFGDFCADFSTRMEFFAVTGKIEVVHAGEHGAGLSEFPHEYEEIAGESVKTALDIREFTDTLGEKMDNISQKLNHESWKKMADTVHTLIERINELIDTTTHTASDDSTVLIKIVTGQQKHIEKASENADSIKAAFKSTTDAITEISGCAKDQKEFFGRIRAAAEKVCVLADDLYPEEE